MERVLWAVLLQFEIPCRDPHKDFGGGRWATEEVKRSGGQGIRGWEAWVQSLYNDNSCLLRTHDMPGPGMITLP